MIMLSDYMVSLDRTEHILENDKKRIEKLRLIALKIPCPFAAENHLPLITRQIVWWNASHIPPSTVAIPTSDPISQYESLTVRLGSGAISGLKSGAEIIGTPRWENLI